MWPFARDSEGSQEYRQLRLAVEILIPAAAQSRIRKCDGIAGKTMVFLNISWVRLRALWKGGESHSPTLPFWEFLVNPINTPRWPRVVVYSWSALLFWPISSYWFIILYLYFSDHLFYIWDNISLARRAHHAFHHALTFPRLSRRQLCFRRDGTVPDFPLFLYLAFTWYEINETSWQSGKWPERASLASQHPDSTGLTIGW